MGKNVTCVDERKGKKSAKRINTEKSSFKWLKRKTRVNNVSLVYIIFKLQNIFNIKLREKEKNTLYNLIQFFFTLFCKFFYMLNVKLA